MRSIQGRGKPALIDLGNTPKKRKNPVVRHDGKGAVADWRNGPAAGEVESVGGTGHQG